MQVEIKPYVLDEQPCDHCGVPFAAQFCAALDCLHYLCDGCWERVHSADSRREQHRPLLKQTAEGSGSRAPGVRASASAHSSGAHAAGGGGAHRSKSGAGANSATGGCNSHQQQQQQQQARGARSGGGGHQSGRRPRGLHASQAPRLSGAASHAGSGIGAARNLNVNVNQSEYLMGDSCAAATCGFGALQASGGAGDVCGKMSLFPETSQFQYY